MSKLPRGLSGKEVVKALKKAGFSIKRQKGSHIIMGRDEPFAQVVVPNHQCIDTGTLVIAQRLLYRYHNRSILSIISSIITILLTCIALPLIINRPA